ncbi:acyloxyacyl hydrolase [Alphaproteobacteria bacterium]|jgi:hypothetical protein|nr:acyloxyacyl hydrolase [Alphaproteobacteria bacterium]
MKNWHHKATLGLAFALTIFAQLGTSSTARAQDPAVYYIASAALATVLPGFVFDLPQPDANRSYVKMSGGYFDAIDDEQTAVDFSLEYQPGSTWHRIKPLIGVAGNTDGSFYGWLAVAHDFHLTKRFVVNFNIGPALYIVGEKGKNLGSAGVLRSGFEVGYRFDGGTRLTGSFHHMSHGKLLNSDLNPGTETIAVNLSWPLN